MGDKPSCYVHFLKKLSPFPGRCILYWAVRWAEGKCSSGVLLCVSSVYLKKGFINFGAAWNVARENSLHFSPGDHWFPAEMTSEERAQKFHTDDVSLPSTLDSSWREENLLQPIRITIQICLVTRHWNGLSEVLPQTSVRGESSHSDVSCES